MIALVPVAIAALVVIAIWKFLGDGEDGRWDHKADNRPSEGVHYRPLQVPPSPPFD